MRGKDEDVFLRHDVVGITPAYAGKSDNVTIQGNTIRDHPRLCGEKGFPYAVRMPLLGSPPPMRGKGVSIVYDNGAIGITPAYAGKSGLLYAFCVCYEDHPRLCGEKCLNKWNPD